METKIWTAIRAAFQAGSAFGLEEHPPAADLRPKAKRSSSEALIKRSDPQTKCSSSKALLHNKLVHFKNRKAY